MNILGEQAITSEESTHSSLSFAQPTAVSGLEYFVQCQLSIGVCGNESLFHFLPPHFMLLTRAHVTSLASVGLEQENLGSVMKLLG